MKLCQACIRGCHEHCSAQVRAADMPCSCEHCWGKGGSEAVYQKIEKLTYPNGFPNVDSVDSDEPIIIKNGHVTP